MPRNQHGQRTGHNGKTLWSGSQLKQRTELGGCDVRWGHNRLLKLQEPEGKNAARGTKAHGENEAWYLFGTLPTEPHSCGSLLTVKCQPRYKTEAFRRPTGTFNAEGKPLFRVETRWVEHPHMVEVEVPVRFDHLGECFIGYIDMAYDWTHDGTQEADGFKPWDRECDGDIAPVGTTGVTVIHDWKFSSSTNYAMTPAELEMDVAANIYAHEAFLGGAERVLCRWVYTAFDSQKPKEVWCEIDRDKNLALMNYYAEVARDGSEKKQLFKDGKLNVLTLEKNYNQCHAYRQDCPFMGTCNPHREVQKIKMRSDTDMASFEEQAENVAGTAPAKTLPPIPGAKKAPPPPPVKKAPPPPPVKSSPVDAAVAAAAKGPLTENGTFNAPINEHTPEGVKAPSATPEQAAAAQGRDKGVEILEQTDVTEETLDLVAANDAVSDNSDLDALDTPQLKLLATSMGLTFLPRAKTASMKQLIIDARAKGVPADRTIDELPEAAEEPSTDAEVEELAAEHNISFEQAHQLVEETPKKVAPPAPAPKAAPVGFGGQRNDISDAEIAAYGRAAIEKDKRTGFTLYINCAPQGEAYHTLPFILQQLAANFEEATGKKDYRQVDFGKGPGLMAESIADDLENGLITGDVVIDVRTHEGSAFVSTFERFARRVIRGF